MCFLACRWTGEGLPRCQKRYLIRRGADYQSTQGKLLEPACYFRTTVLEDQILDVGWPENALIVVEANDEILQDGEVLRALGQQVNEYSLIEGDQLEVAVFVGLLPEHVEPFIRENGYDCRC